MLLLVVLVFAMLLTYICGIGDECGVVGGGVVGVVAVVTYAAVGIVTVVGAVYAFWWLSC